jgi:G3E family GTPase
LRPEFRDRVRVDSIVSVADAESFSLDLFASRPARNQLVYADVILLNKCDLVGADRVRSIEEKIRDVAERARIVQTTRCGVSLPLILSIGQFQPDRYLTALTDPVSDGHLHRHNATERPHLLDDGFESVSFEADRPFAADKFQRFLEQLPENVFRAKGVLWIDVSDRGWVFHLVGKRFTLDESGGASPMRNRLVLIGRNLDRVRLREELANCLV